MLSRCACSLTQPKPSGSASRPSAPPGPPVRLRRSRLSLLLTTAPRFFLSRCGGCATPGFPPSRAGLRGAYAPSLALAPVHPGCFARLRASLRRPADRPRRAASPQAPYRLLPRKAGKRTHSAAAPFPRRTRLRWAPAGPPGAARNKIKRPAGRPRRAALCPP